MAFFNIDKDSVKLLIKYFFISKAIVVIGILFSIFIMGIDIKSIFFNFDATHYINIAINGYTRSYQYAFFPLYPLLIRLFSVLGVPYVVSGVLISNLLHIASGLILLVLNNKYLKQKEEALLLVFFLSFNSVFFSSVYTESLFLFLTLLSFTLYKNKNWILSGILLGLSVATRNIGSLLFFAIFIELLINKEKFLNIIKMYIPATIISLIYPIYLYIYTGNFFKFASVQKECWGAEFTNPLSAIIRDIKVFFLSKQPIFSIVVIFSFISIYIALYLIVKNFKKENIALIIYMLLGVLVPLLSSKIFSFDTLTGMPSTTSLFRYIFALFPIYIFSSKISNIKWYLRIHVIIGLILSIAYYSNVFIA